MDWFDLGLINIIQPRIVHVLDVRTNRHPAKDRTRRRD